MDTQAISAAQSLAQYYMQRYAGDMIDGRALVRAAVAGYLAGSGVPTDRAVEMVEELVARNLVNPAPMNPMYYGIPWMVAGPTSGVPYYSER